MVREQVDVLADAGAMVQADVRTQSTKLEDLTTTVGALRAKRNHNPTADKRREANAGSVSQATENQVRANDRADGQICTDCETADVISMAWRVGASEMDLQTAEQLRASAERQRA